MIINDKGWVLNLNGMLYRGSGRRASELPRGRDNQRTFLREIWAAGKEGFLP